MKKDPIDVFDNWAINGRDEGLAEGHAPSVEGMLEWLLPISKALAFLMWGVAMVGWLGKW